ncbi:type II secretion system minor pseudopilin GspI [Pantoea sp. Mb-10]|uniref:type II secretion system minor pseudopilin GspI n=1 Tax=unclassified Pantoea TaxID=2630326 RepID=UPI001E502FF2|nr:MULTISPECIES: type II secretion system minor pseudopilin GspI [unclassified Pantoea]MCE0489652.1 type II secretion system minor pseudopilin GspI [Pantoea sp. Mb-10]MCE0501243.1 type II secretion system minor pseudopilin GspI [Pantoea sp. Pb-8]
MKQSGMTLLEVMVAMAMLAIAGVAMLSSSQQQLRFQGELTRKQLAIWVAENQLALTRLASPRAAQNQQGEAWMADQRWYWRQQVRPTDRAGVYGIEVSVAEDARFNTVLAQLHGWQQVP